MSNITATPKTGLEVITTLGYCHDCAQGLIGKTVDGFALFVLDGTPSHWFCRYCGSNHVTIRDENGNTLFEQGDLYIVGGAA